MKTRQKYELALYAAVIAGIFFYASTHQKDTAKFIIGADVDTMKWINICSVTIGILIWFRVKSIFNMGDPVLNFKNRSTKKN